MILQALPALLVFACVASITPGPNNLMLLASGANFGFARTMPHLLGVTIGFKSLLLGVGLGLGALLAAFPALHAGLKMAGGGYLLWLAWRIGTSRSMSAAGDGRRLPLKFLESATFQWVNPKAWMMATTAMAMYANPEAPFLSVLLISITFALVNLPCIAVWAAFGVALREFLSNSARLKWFNVSMGALLAATLWPMLR